MILEKFTKQPFDEKDYAIDYEEWLDKTGDTLDDVTPIVTCLTDPADDSLMVTTQITAKRIVLWVSGGTDRHKYKVELNVVTAAGRKEQVELIFTVKDV